MSDIIKKPISLETKFEDISERKKTEDEITRLFEETKKSSTSIRVKTKNLVLNKKV